ncbi:hypothetical protein JY651_35815 [Pyxidicoccus parkwayensis]|uniref:Uncharacterized protein n=1 Tax=Pyxidicoccus parkwayensis TaxID=2813578 RepID=A0ABX7NT34_9BACT|nr:hypothetical protein [Pyxidicoccus parkwaysis]QSQ20569.1 hypothetical protein JY651_35815 [Pyxidicoccus parkwaysis]
MAIVIPEEPLDTPFTIPTNRREITEEGSEDFLHGQVSWDGTSEHGGGHVPEDYAWPTNPKEHQDELMGEWPLEP